MTSATNGSGRALMYNLLDAKHFAKEYDPAFCISVGIQLAYEVEEFISARKRGEGHDVWEMQTKNRLRQCERLFARIEEPEDPEAVTDADLKEVNFFNELVDRCHARLAECLAQYPSTNILGPPSTVNLFPARPVSSSEDEIEEEPADTHYYHELPSVS